MDKNSVGLSAIHESLTGGSTIIEMPPMSPQTPIGDKTSKNIIFLLKEGRKGDVYVPGEEIVMNKSGVMEKIRLLNGIPTIWSSEQEKSPLVTQYFVSKNTRSLHFQANVCRIPEWDTTALEFARISRCNVDSNTPNKSTKFAFYEYNPEKAAQEALAKEDFEIEMTIKAKDTPPDAMKKHAAYLGIAFTNELGLPKTDDALRKDYIRIAKKDPVNFSKSYNSPVVEVSWLIKKALIDSKIDLGRIANTAYFSNGGFICKIPKAEKAVEYLVEFAMLPTEESKAFLEKLKSEI